MRFPFLMGAAFAIGALSAVPAAAQTAEGSIQVKAFATGVLPDGSINDVRIDAIGLPAGSDTRADDNYVPTVAIEYFITPSLSLETICCITSHDVTGAGALAGAELIDGITLLPATVTAKYHLQLGSVKPYVGAGAAYFFMWGEEPGAAARTLGATRVNLSEELGAVVQAGLDVPLNDNGLGLSLDAKRYFIGTTATFFAGNAVALQTDHDLDPWVVSAGLSYRF